MDSARKSSQDECRASCPTHKHAEELTWQQSKLHGNSHLAPGNELGSGDYLPGTLEFRLWGLGL